MKRQARVLHLVKRGPKRVTSIPVGRPVIPELMTVADVAERLGCAASSVYDLVDKGELVAVNRNPGSRQRRLLIPEAEFVAFLKRNETKGKAS